MDSHDAKAAGSGTSCSRKRGPYGKWKSMDSSEIALVPDDSAEADVPMRRMHDTKKNKVLEHEECEPASDTDVDTIDCQIQVSEEDITLEGRPNVTNLEDYMPIINDEEDNILDELFNDLRTAALEEDKLKDEEAMLFDNVAQFMSEPEQVDADTNVGAQDDQSESPIFKGSRRLLGVTIMLLCCFMIRFHLPDDAMSYLLSLLGLLLPDDNKVPKSLYGIRQFLKKHTFLPEVRYYCSFCYTHVSKDSKTCSNVHCLKDLTIPGSLAYFVLHSCIAQLQTMFKRKSFTDSVRSHRFRHYSRNSSNISDIYDGSNYKKLFENGFLNDENSLSFAMNTDGVAIFRSSRVSIWPVYLMINELPIKQRKLRENMVFYGVWISSKKPLMWSFLKPMHEELKQLEEGISMVDYEGKSITCRATILTCTCDLPAKCLVSNSIQYNGKHSCWYCLQQGETFTTEKGGHCHVFPYNTENPTGPERTVSSVKHDVNQAVTNIQNGDKLYASRGIKGPSWFLFLSYFNVIDGYVIDYMHGVCSGVMKTLLTLWFSKDHKQKEYSCFTLRQKVNAALAQIRPTINITRLPRSLEEIVHWKSSEYRNFLLYWGVPVLRNVLKKDYFLHFCLLVQAIFLLSKEEISPEDIVTAHQSLLIFVEKCELLYTRKVLTMNFHQLLHLTKNVVANGPLFVNNCFVFEDFNGYIVKHIHGSQGVTTQIINTINIVQALPILAEKYLACGTQEWDFHKSLMDAVPTNRTLIEHGIYGIGTPQYKKLNEQEYLAINTKFNLLAAQVHTFNKIYVQNGEFFIYGSAYKRTLRNQSVVKYKLGNRTNFGTVNYFVQFADGTAVTQNIAILYPYRIIAPLCSKAVFIVEVLRELEVVAVEDIIGSAILVKQDDTTYICEIPNRYDRD